ncbi:hypothetical protein GCM10010992_10310 [Cloacibacterium rupense]|uniref:Uncharacterized protein n=1 Tax=Cloacibacterium rupense TaxID=517423 RepID=A0ABQ2NIT8_9FLAO|nr:hypothetical protein [Cloacibacterium rupense]GGP03132.1 hypothetical protein GCM10010992_10310 [Cloacibacterium rupense]
MPSIAVLFDWEISTLNNTISEEEVKNNVANFNEKIPPKPYKISDYLLQKIHVKTEKNTFNQMNASVRINPFISIFSPPPEV